LLGTLAGVLSFCVLFTAGGAFAYWVTSTSSSVPAAVADTLPQGATPGATTSGSAVTVSFATVDTTNGTSITAYTVNRYAVGGITPSESFPCPGSTTPVTCADPSVPTGQWQYTDTPDYGANWVGIESDKSPVVDVTSSLPSVNITYPVTATTYGTDWAGAITGTAGDTTSAIATVDVAIENTTTDEWWDGTSFEAPTQTFIPVTSGTTDWSLTFAVGALTSGDIYSVVAQATDVGGDVGTSPTVTFSFSTGPPPQTPEVPAPLMIPGAAVLMFLGGYLIMRRRQRVAAKS
jgi:hypothetical protein